MARIALYLPDLRGGGVQRMMLHLTSDFLARGHEVDLVMSRAAGDYLEQVPSAARMVVLERAGRLHSRLLSLRATPPSAWSALAAPVLLARKPDKQLFHVDALARYLRTQRPDALIAAGFYHNLAAIWASRLAQAPSRIMLTVRNNLSQELAIKNAQSARWRALPPLIGQLYALADAIVTVSEGVGDDLAATTGLPRARITTIYNPVVTPQLAELAALEAPHPWLRAQSEVPVIVAAGRLLPQKNFPLLLQAFARLRAQRPVRLIIFGEGNARAQLEALVGELKLGNDVALPGFITNPYAAFSRAALFVLSSDFEGLGNVVIEALACGCPVVSTNCPSGPAEILEDGRYGELVPMRDPEALAQAMARTLAAPLPASILRRRGHEFSLERGMRRYLELLLPDAVDATKSHPDAPARLVR
jgi:glycosyltransferase involved in cell wall biosynthesis